MLTLKLNAVQVLALSCFGVVMGTWLNRKLPILDRLNIPPSITGGLVYALLALILRDRWLNLEMDLVLRDILMVAFFTTIGMSASLAVVRAGGPQVLLFFGIASVGAALQNLVGIAMAHSLSLDPLLGIISGSVAMTGGPATALAFGRTFEEMGATGATTLGVAAAMFGIVAGGLLGGYTGGWVIRRHGVALPDRSNTPQVASATTGSPATEHTTVFGSALLQTVVAIAVAMGVGTLISTGFRNLGLTLPAYVGAMIAAAFVRNLDDHFHFVGISQRVVEDIGTVSLYVFIVMALLTLQLWELVHLALPMLVMLLVQVALVWILAVTITYRLMGRDFDAAVMAGGYCGFMLGTTANALACMDVLVQKYGPAPRAFIVVPLVGAFLIDFTNALIITAFADLVRAFVLK